MEGARVRDDDDAVVRLRANPLAAWHRPERCLRRRRDAAPTATTALIEGRLWHDMPGRLCARCFPRCVVCQTEGGMPMPCASRHGVCRACLHAHVGRLPPGTLPRCPCGDGGRLDVRRFPDSLWTIFADRCFADGPAPPRAEQDAEAGAPSTTQDALALLDMASQDACPCCARVYVDFDGCAALRCECGAWFCALCLARCESSQKAHAHVRQCVEAVTGEATYFVALETWRRVRDRRRARNVLAHMRCIAAARGVRHAAAVAWHAHRMGIGWPGLLRHAYPTWTTSEAEEGGT